MKPFLKNTAVCNLLLISIFSLFSTIAFAQTAPTYTFTVTKTDDPNPFTCDTCSAMIGTLRWAITEANEANGNSLINFNIPGAGSQTILLNSSLPNITNNVTIDASTQSGYQFGNPSVIIDANSLYDAFEMSCTLCELKGFYIKNFQQYGIEVDSSMGVTILDNVINSISTTTSTSYSSSADIALVGANHIIKGNILGTDINNTNYSNANAAFGIYSDGPNNNVIGDTSSAGKNIIAYHDSAGVLITHESGNIISGNEIYNNQIAIELAFGANNSKPAPTINTITDLSHVTGKSAPGDTIELFGSTGPQNANPYLKTVIAGADSTWSASINPAVFDTCYSYISATATDTNKNTSELTTSNQFCSPCNKLNFTINPDTIVIKNYGFSLPPNTTNTSSGYSANQLYIWNFGSGFPIDTILFNDYIPIPYYSYPGTYPVTLTTPDTSSCSGQSITKNITVLSLQCSPDTVFQNTFIVTDTLDSDPYCTTCTGSLRWAINMANAATGSSRIIFNIPGNGPHTISLNSTLPPIFGYNFYFSIDASTQTGYQYGRPSIIIDGNDSIDYAFYIANQVQLKGFYIKHFTQIGVIAGGGCIQIIDNVINSISGSTTNSNGLPKADIFGQDINFSTIKGNILGTDISGTDYSSVNSMYGICIEPSMPASNLDVIGDTTTTGKNIIAYHDSVGVYLLGYNANNALGSVIHIKVSGNEIFNNSKAIELVVDANYSKPKPTINTITDVSHVTGKSAPGDIVELFGSTGPENANQYLKTVVTDTSGHWSTSLNPATFDTCYNYISATATDSLGNTSELSTSNYFSYCCNKLNFTSQDTLYIQGDGLVSGSYTNISTGYPDGQNFIWNVGTNNPHGSIASSGYYSSYFYAQYTSLGTYTVTLSTPDTGLCPAQSISKTITVLPFVCDAGSNVIDTFVVTKTTDPDPFTCDTCPDMIGTLRWAITEANASNGVSLITFNIPGTETHTISLNSTLPSVWSIIIDASTQPGFQYGNPAVVIDGGDSIPTAFEIYQQTILKGFYIKNFTSAGVFAEGYCIQILDNVIDNISGGTYWGNATADIIGEVLTFSTIKGNFLGTDAHNTNYSTVNSNYGIYVLSGSGFTNFDEVGDTTATGKNIIAYHDSAGIYVMGIHVHISGNEIYKNDTAISLFDLNESELGFFGNFSKPQPIINTITNLSNVTGTANPGDIIELFGSTGSQQANLYLTSAITDSLGHWVVNFCNVPAFVSGKWNYISATATDATGNTSELAVSNFFNLPLNCNGINFTSSVPSGGTVVFTNTSTVKLPPDSSGYFQWCFGDGICDSIPASGRSYTNTPISHTYKNPGTYTVTLCLYNPGLVSCTSGPVTIPPSTEPLTCINCIGSFAPEPGKYLVSAWVKEENAPPGKLTYTYPKIFIQFPTSPGSTSYSSPPLGPFTGQGIIIDGWQRIEAEFVVPTTALYINLQLISDSANCYFDDIRIFPFDGSMKSYVYDPVNLRLVAELDERNYATLYEYDEEGKLIRVKKETENGVMTIKENRNSSFKQ